MTKLIHTIFSSPKEAEVARNYLVESGFEQVSLENSALNLPVNEDNWISAFEIVKSLGGDIQDDPVSLQQLEEYYKIQDEGNGEELDEDIEIEIIDEDAYIDPNLGYGDFELIEPYVLETYEELVEHEELGRDE